MGKPVKPSVAAYDAIKYSSIAVNILKLPSSFEGAQDDTTRAVVEEVKRVLRPYGGRWKGGVVNGFVFKDMSEVVIRERVEEILAAGADDAVVAQHDHIVQLRETGNVEVEMNLGDLKEAMKKVKEVVNEKPILPVLTNVMFSLVPGKVTLTATDLSVTVVAEMECDYAGNELQLGVPFKSLHKFLDTLQVEVVRMEYDGAGVSFKGGGDSVLSIDTVADMGTWPEMMPFPVEHVLEINHDLVHWMKKSLLTISKDSLKPALCHVYMKLDDTGEDQDRVTIATTNAYCLMEQVLLVERPVNDEMGVTLPAKDRRGVAKLLVSPVIVNALNGFERVSINYNETHVGFKAYNITIIGRLPDVKFPDYEAVIPVVECNVTFIRSRLISVMKQMEIAGAYGEAYMKKEEGWVVFKALDIDNGRHVTSRLEATYTGDVERIAFYPAQLLNVLNQLECDLVSVAIYDPVKAMVVKDPEDAGYTAIVLPCRV